MNKDNFWNILTLTISVVTMVLLFLTKRSILNISLCFVIMISQIQILLLIGDIRTLRRWLNREW